MLHPRDLYAYQKRAITHMLKHPRSMLWLPMGAGKTASALSVAWHLKKHGVSKGTLVVGPLRVVESVWRQEAKKWSHLKDLRIALIHGTKETRMAALFSGADIFLVNYEGLAWLSAQLQHYFCEGGYPMPFDFLVPDEVTKLKNATTGRHTALAPILPYFKRRVGLTGTPATEGYIDLHGQYLVIDDGRRLGVDKSSYESSYFSGDGYQDYDLKIKTSSKAIIHRAIHDITLEMTQDEVIKLPDLIVHDVRVDLPRKAQKQYDTMERSFIAELETGEELLVETQVDKINKLLQMSNGAVYTNPETREWTRVHDAKLEALEDIVEEAAGNPILMAYKFRSDAERVLKRFPFARDLSPLNGDQFNQAIHDFQLGHIRLLIGHPASMGHGVDGLQKNCSIIVWFGLNWSLEQTLQFNARVHRNGREDVPVRCYRIIGNDTYDEVVDLRLTGKVSTQDDLRAAVLAYRVKKGLQT